MSEPFFNLPHRLSGLDRRRTGHAANRLPRRLGAVAQVGICLYQRLAFHLHIVVNQVVNPQHMAPNNQGRSQN
ncbi:MAG: hypothetical protein OXI17_04585 [Gammaproteobacteria bacterium]|nr:hypothetical protein [Gammaproteobacteria bacterium]